MCQASASSTSGHLQSPLVPQPSTSFSGNFKINQLVYTQDLATNFIL